MIYVAADIEQKYNFTGDISSLKDATEGAIKLLDQYQNKIRSLTVSNNFTKNAQINKSLNSVMSSTAREIFKLQDKFKPFQDINLFQSSPEARKLAEAMRTLQNTFNSFSNQSKVVAKDARELASTLRTVRQSFKDVGPAIDSLIEKEKLYQSASGDTGRKTTEAVKNMHMAFNRLAQPFDSLISKIESFKAKATSALDRVGTNTQKIGSIFRQFKGNTDDSSDGVSDFANALSVADPKISASLKSIKVLSKAVKALGSAFNAIKGIINSVRGVLNNFSSAAAKSADALKPLTQLIGGAVAGFTLSDITQEAIAYIENLNLFTVAMSDAVDEGLRFVDTMSEIYGMDPSNLYRYAGYFYQLTDAIGMSEQASKIVSLSLTKAANDIASLYNVEIEQVVNNLSSGMQGISVAVRKYGIDIRQATLAQTALNYGFTENVATTSEANRQALRYLTIMEQVKNATRQVTTTADGATKIMGDFARNIETPANQLRILKEQATQVARAFGTFFIPIMQKTLYVINGVLMAIKTLLQFLATLAGIDINLFGGEVSKGASDVADAVGDIGSAAKGAAKDLQKLIAPFDELTILSQPKDTGGGGIGGGLGADILDPNLLKAIEAMSLGLDDIRMKALDVRDKVLELLGLEYDGSDIKVTVGGFIDNLTHLWDAADYTGFGERIAQFFNLGIGWGIIHTDPAKYASVLNEKVKILADILNGLVKGFDWAGLGTIIGNGIVLALGMLDTFLITFNWRQLGQKLASGFNGIIYSIDWTLLGKTIGDRFMSTIRGLTGFFEEFDWIALGAGLGKGFKSLILAIKWDELGHLIVVGLNGLIDTVGAFFAEYEWGTLGSKLAQFFSVVFKELNWRNLGSTISKVLRGLMLEIETFLGQLDWYALGKGVGTMLMSIDWFGIVSDVIRYIFGYDILGGAVKSVAGLVSGIFSGIGISVKEGFQNGILEGFKNIGSWLKEHLVDPVVRAVKNFFGIHSPSTVFKEIGINLILGLLNGILESIRNISTWLKQNIIDPILNGIKNPLGITGATSSVLRDIGSSIVNGLMSGLETVGSKLSSWGNSIVTTITGAFNSVSRSANSILNTVTNTTNSVNKLLSVQNSVNSLANSVSRTGTAVRIAANSIKGVKMATGGVVNGPTQALIGEGRYSEAVIPLGNSPELQEMIDKIANAVNQTPKNNSRSNSDTPIEVHVYIDSEEITTRQNQRNRMYGRTQQNI